MCADSATSHDYTTPDQMVAGSEKKQSQETILVSILTISCQLRFHSFALQSYRCRFMARYRVSTFYTSTLVHRPKPTVVGFWGLGSGRSESTLLDKGFRT